MEIVHVRSTMPQRSGPAGLPVQGRSAYGISGRGSISSEK